MCYLGNSEGVKTPLPSHLITNLNNELEVRKWSSAAHQAPEYHESPVGFLLYSPILVLSYLATRKIPGRTSESVSDAELWAVNGFYESSACFQAKIVAACQVRLVFAKYAPRL